MKVKLIRTGEIKEVNKEDICFQHRIMCGDSTKKEDVDKLMNGQKADMVLTDPPYGIDLDIDFLKIHSNNELGHKGKQHPIFEKVIGDNEEFNPTFIINYFSYCKEIFLWGADYYLNYINNKGSWFIWDKVCGRFDGRIGNDFEMCWSKVRHKKEIIENLWVGYKGLEKEDTKSRIHPTQKPVKLNIFFIDKFSKIDNIIVDLFLGSGSTLIACEQTNRICYGMELDPKYCEVICQRYEKLTGKQRELINN
jgi:DNA modification methylase